MAAAFAPKLGRSLASPDPHHGAGSAGYCPPNESCGQLISPLPTSPEVAGSSQLMLQPAPWPCHGAQPVQQAGELLGTRPACWGAGAQPLGCCVIPGYTGFIPRAQNLFAKTYSEICKEARSDFARQQLRAAGQEQELQKAGRLPQGTKGKLLTTKYRTPGLAAAPYGLPFAFQPQGSPYSMEDNNPHKCFISAPSHLTVLPDKPSIGTCSPVCGKDHHWWTVAADQPPARPTQHRLTGSMGLQVPVWPHLRPAYPQRPGAEHPGEADGRLAAGLGQFLPGAVWSLPRRVQEQ
ncbi:ciliary microtubule inner protein 2B isoform X1 [Caretta caretta]|uniref:ciliary microtubule inner protein 2B isoform X1 n=1 Tax=Caretta caretta TaxID=8467 RepID=UPI003F4C2219